MVQSLDPLLTEESLSKFLDKKGFATSKPDILSKILPCLYLVPAGVDITASFIGGGPFVEPSLSWPLNSKGRPMEFLAQLSLGQLGQALKKPLENSIGDLLFFAAIGQDVMPAHREGRVIFLSSDSKAKLRS